LVIVKIDFFVCFRINNKCFDRLVCFRRSVLSLDSRVTRKPRFLSTTAMELDIEAMVPELEGYQFGAVCIDLPKVQPLDTVEKTREAYWRERGIYLTPIQDITARFAFMDIVNHAQLPQPIEEAGADGETIMRCPIHNTPVGCYEDNICECYRNRRYEHEFLTSEKIENALHAGLKVFIKAWTEAGGRPFAKACLARSPRFGERPDWNYMEYFHEEPVDEPPAEGGAAAGAGGDIH
jgi:hypothetical protein